MTHTPAHNDDAAAVPAPPARPAPGGARREQLRFGLSLAALILACLVAGGALRPRVERVLAGRRTPDRGTLALVLEHAAVDLKLGRGAVVLAPLQVLVPKVHEPRTRAQLLGLVSEAALQAGHPDAALRADEERELLAAETEVKLALRQRRVALLATLGRGPEAKALARALATESPARADEIRVQLAAALHPGEQLKAWVQSVTREAKPDPEEVRTAGLVALTVLRDAAQAERLLASLVQPDAGVLRALAEAYAQLKRPADVARIAQPLAALAKDPREASEVELLRARALLDAGDAASALTALEGLSRAAPTATLRQAARRARYQVLQRQGALAAEVAALERQGALPLRAFVALEIEGRYDLAAQLYQRLMASGADDAFERLFHEAQRRKELAERRNLYAGVLQKDPQDARAAEKLLAALVGLRDTEGVQKFLEHASKGAGDQPAALVELGQLLVRAGLPGEAVRVLEKAYAVEIDAAKKQQILLTVADLYADARRSDQARRVYLELAQGG
ncbi:MAG TPA: hypothetical protein VGQ83_40360, partial [Polyangia bacterium]